MKQELVLRFSSNWASTYVQLEITSNNKFEKKTINNFAHSTLLKKDINTQLPKNHIML